MAKSNYNRGPGWLARPPASTPKRAAKYLKCTVVRGQCAAWKRQGYTFSVCIQSYGLLPLHEN